MALEQRYQLQIAKLDFENAHLWFVKMKNLLDEYKLDKYVTGEAKLPVPAPSEDATAKKLREEQEIKFREEDARTKRLMLANVQNTDVQGIQLVASAADAWNDLKRFYRSDTWGYEMGLIEKLFHAKMGAEEDPREFIKRLRTIANNLAAIGSPVDSKYVACSLILGLPKDYDQVQLRLNEEVGKPALDKVVQALQHEALSDVLSQHHD